MIKFSYLIEKLFNVNRGEWSRVTLSWFINFFYRIAFVIGWTIIVGMFVSKYGISSLPMLFVWNGVFTIIGTVIYATFIDKLPKEKIILYSILLATWLLTMAVFFSSRNATIFFALLLSVESIFLVQLKIVANGFVETMFTPLESERTFSLIESAETIGGLIAGILVTVFSTTINPSSFVYLWIIALLFIVPCLYYYKFILKGVYRFNLDNEATNHHSGLVEKVKEVSSQVRHISFIKGLFFVVIFQWIFANLIEFQYTKAVYSSVSEVAMTSGSGFEHALVHDLGALFILFSAAALLVQLFIGSRLITSLGVIGSMLIYPILMILSVFGLTVRFGFNMAVLAQTNKNIGSVIYTNSYHSAYYSIKEHFREHTREFLEGIIRPFGAIIGTVILISLQEIFTAEIDLTLAINLTMIGALIILFFVTYGLQSRYTRVACHNLLNGDDKFDKINAIDILSQKGHKSAIPVLLQLLHDPKESDYIKIKILRALGELQEFDTLDDIIECFKSKKVEIRLAAVEAMTGFQSLKGLLSKNVFYEFKMIEAIKSLYTNERNEEIRSMIIHMLSKMNPIGTFGFLLNILKKAKNGLKAEVILALGNYKDPRVLLYLKPFLHSKKSMERAAAIISLWDYDEFNDELLSILEKMLKSENLKSREAAIFVIGELQLKFKQKELRHALLSQDKRLKMFASVALAKMGYTDCVHTIVELMFDPNQEFAVELKKIIKKLSHKVRKVIESEIKQIVSAKINDLLVKTKAKSLNYLNTKYLKYLKILYSLVEENEEVELISELLYARKFS